jgi:hypothetical protein
MGQGGDVDRLCSEPDTSRHAVGNNMDGIPGRGIRSFSERVDNLLRGMAGRVEHDRVDMGFSTAPEGIEIRNRRIDEYDAAWHVSAH